MNVFSPAMMAAIQQMGVTASEVTFDAPLADLSNGEVNTALSIGSGAATVIRSTVAWTRLANGLWVEKAANVPRSYYDYAGTYQGYYSEHWGRNEALWARDLTNAAWGKTTVTAAKDQAGIDGVSNSCTGLTATAGLGTCLQTVTATSRQYSFHCYLKRITGTGTIEITFNGGASWADVTAALAAAGGAWTDIGKILVTGTVANPSFGFRITTNGDAIAVDMCQLQEFYSLASSPIPTTTVRLFRDFDYLTYPAAGNVSFPCSFYAEVQRNLLTSNTGRGVMGVSGGSDVDNVYLLNDGSLNVKVASVVQALVNTSVHGSGMNKVASRADTNDFAKCRNGGAVGTDVSGSVPALGNLTEIAIGVTRFSWTTQIGSPMKNVRIYNVAKSNAELQALTA